MTDSVRAKALALLLIHRKTDQFLKEVLSGSKTFSSLPPRDRAFVNELVHGVVRETYLLDHLIDVGSKTPAAKLEHRVLEVLRVGFYQVLFMDGVPPFAAVNETVSLVADRRVRGFVNANMRSLLRALDESRDGDVVDPRRDLYLAPGRRARFHKPVFPDPAKKPADFLAAAYSHPEWLLARWLKQFGREVAENILRAGRAAPRVALFPNLLKMDLRALAENLRAHGVECAVDESVGVVFVHGAVAELPGYKEGVFYVQDPTASLPVLRLAPKPGEKILDLCAAPGTKTAQLAILSRDQATIDAVDADANRLARVTHNLRRLGLRSVRVRHADGKNLPPEIPPAAYDKILLDAPCSNTGVLRRRVEVRYRLTPKDIADCARSQRELLSAAATRLKPGATLVYSTCSLEPEENADAVHSAGLTLVEQKLTLPSDTADGGYYAVLQK